MDNLENIKKSHEIRESYSSLPFQGFWSWLTGKELLGRVTSISHTPVTALFWSTLWFIGGIASSISVIESSVSNWFLLITTLFSVAGARYIVATMIHQAVHNSLFDSPLLNRVYSELFSTVLIVQPFDSYRQFHVEEHHSDAFSTMDDKDLSALYKLGFKPGKSLSEMKVRLMVLCLSPVFHIQYLWGRLKSNFIGTPVYRKFMTVFWLASLSIIAQSMGFNTFVITIALPFTVIYQICSLLHLLTEHTWIIKAQGAESEQAHIDNCLGRFSGRMLPKTTGKPIQDVVNRAIWGLEHLFYHLPIRMLVLQGTLTVHDWHHRFGAHPDWVNTIQLREEEVQKQLNSGTCDYVDIWGFHNVIEYVLKSVSEADELQESDMNYTYRLN